MERLALLEAILFIASKPLSLQKIAGALETSEANIEELVETLIMKYNHEESGIHILSSDSGIQMASNPQADEAIGQFIKYEVNDELTKAQLETLTVIAYQGPITRPELEQIRGVNCSVILRNLLIRGLVEERPSDEKLMDVYSLSTNALAHLGVQSVTQLPEYDTLHHHAHITTKQDIQS